MKVPDAVLALVTFGQAKSTKPQGVKYEVFKVETVGGVAQKQQSRGRQYEPIRMKI
ncbi:MAG: hypothetical protein IPI23_00340 [Bacteroidetes bacterium]|nr:hypothetical protein [Bacteroidota bacterium]